MDIGGKIWILLVAFLSALLAVCAGCQQTSEEQASGEPKGEWDARAEARAGDAGATAKIGRAGAVARAGDAVARAGGDAEARAGDVVAGGSDEAAESPGGARNAREVVIEIEGDPGTRFSGTCSVGDEEEEIGGKVSRRFTYVLDGRKLECEIRKRGEDAGALRVVLAAGNSEQVQQTDSRRATIRIAYTGQGFSSSVQSSSLSSSASQTISSSSSSVSFSTGSR